MNEPILDVVRARAAVDTYLRAAMAARSELEDGDEVRPHLLEGALVGLCAGYPECRRALMVAAARLSEDVAKRKGGAN